jgi:hypothetical protein
MTTRFGIACYNVARTKAGGRGSMLIDWINVIPTRSGIKMISISILGKKLHKIVEMYFFQ